MISFNSILTPPCFDFPLSQVFLFGKGHSTSSNKELKFLLGGKGANLAGMSAMGLSVPPGFTLTTEVCNAFNSHDKKLPKGTWTKVLNSLKVVEKDIGREFGSSTRPLLVSVRSGAAVSTYLKLYTIHTYTSYSLLHTPYPYHTYTGVNARYDGHHIKLRTQ